MPQALACFAQTVGAAFLLSELGAAELVLGALVGAALLIYPVVDLAARCIPHGRGRGGSQHA